MSTILQVRIDSHLVRGDSVRYWNGVWTKDRFIVIDDKSAADEVLKQSWRIVTPLDTKLSVLNYEKAAEYLADPKHYGNEKIVVFSAGIGNIARLVEAGVEFNCPINVVSPEPNGEKKIRAGRAGLSLKDVEDLHMLHDRGYKLIRHDLPEPIESEEDFYQKLIQAENKKEEAK
ncbi:MAG: PTS sugar transporter subunit IIB [Erysipelotrichaceae bacterium]|nr:PTS sugar transporter subunit IIB [Erysipelotrichaceae bacterium]